jgi:hypothetical protein
VNAAADGRNSDGVNPNVSDAISNVQPLHVAGHVTLESPSDRYVISGEGDRIVIDAESLMALRRLQKAASAASDSDTMRGVVGVAQQLLSERGRVRFVARVRGIDVAEVSGQRGDQVRVRKLNALKAMFGAGKGADNAPVSNPSAVRETRRDD